MRTSRFSRRALASERGGTCGRPVHDWPGNFARGDDCSCWVLVLLIRFESSSLFAAAEFAGGGRWPANFHPRGQAAYPPPGQSAPARPGGEPPVATAVSSPGPDASDLMPYPKQSLFDLFRGSSESPPAGVRILRALMPPQVSRPRRQRGSLQIQRPAQYRRAHRPPPQRKRRIPILPDLMPYPKQSLFDLFSNKPAAQ